MKVSASIELIWNQAAQEAIAAEFAQILPEHFLEALLKFAELPVEDVRKHAALGEDVARALADEVAAVRAELADRAIDGTTARRSLRTHMGRGDHKYDGSVMHRSDAAKRLFDDAARMAVEARSETLTAEHVLLAALASPTPAVAAVLGPAVGPRAPKATDTPLLAAHGVDMVRGAADSPADGPWRAAARALAQALLSRERPSVLLICDDDAAARAAVRAAARSFATLEAGPEARGRRIIDISAAPAEGGDDAPGRRMRDLLAEAARAPEVAVFVPPLDSGDRWAGMLRAALAAGALQCIARVGPKAYKRNFEKDAAWQRHTLAVWLHEPPAEEVPWQL